MHIIYNVPFMYYQHVVFDFNIVFFYFQVEDLGIDWDGPVGLNDDSTVVIDEVESPITQDEKFLLELLLTTFNGDDGFTICDRYLFCKSFINVFHS